MAALITCYISLLPVLSIPAVNIYFFLLDVEVHSGQFFSKAVSLGLLWLRYKRLDRIGYTRHFFRQLCPGSVFDCYDICTTCTA